MELNKVYNMDCLEFMKTVPDNSIDTILTDPPYLYLKHKLDRAFDEELFFKECFRILKKDGFLIFFGFGISYHNWNMICYNIGFNHKEDLIWDKGHNTSPFGTISRQHENISIFTKENGIFNDVRLDYLEDRINCNNSAGVWQDINRIISSLKKIKTFEDFEKFKNETKFDKAKHGITAGNKTSKNRGYQMLETIQNGFKTKSIIRIKREHYQMQHPTAKPIKLLELLLRLTTKENDLIFDGFGGGGGTFYASKQIGRNYVGCELDEDYYNIIQKRLSEIQGSLF